MNYKKHSRILAFIVACSILISASAFAQEPKNRTFTPGELAFYNGRDGRPAYVAVSGIVYDVSGRKEWENGIHADLYHVGTDLTIQMESAPHGKEVLQHFPQVGTFITNKKWMPPFLVSLLEQYPILRRHPHPFIVHFPMAFVVAGAIFLILHLYKPNPFPFEKMAFVMLIFGVVSTVPAIVSGLWSWWIVYSLQSLPQVFY
jgi:predicted heme/steroid binding protein